jgi:hypothetical protein
MKSRSGPRGILLLLTAALVLGGCATAPAVALPPEARETTAPLILPALPGPDMCTEGE